MQVFLLCRQENCVIESSKNWNNIMFYRYSLSNLIFVILIVFLSAQQVQLCRLN